MESEVLLQRLRSSNPKTILPNEVKAAALNLLVGQDPSGTSRSSLAELLFLLGNQRRFKPAFRRSLVEFLTEHVTRSMQADACLHSLKRLQSCLLEVSGLFKQKFSISCEVAWLHHQAGQVKRADKEYKAATRTLQLHPYLQPHAVGLFLNYSAFLAEAGHHRPALDFALRAVEQAEENLLLVSKDPAQVEQVVQAYVRAGVEFKALHDYKNALVWLRKAVDATQKLKPTTVLQATLQQCTSLIQEIERKNSKPPLPQNTSFLTRKRQAAPFSVTNHYEPVILGELQSIDRLHQELQGLYKPKRNRSVRNNSFRHRVTTSSRMRLSTRHSASIASRRTQRINFSAREESPRLIHILTDQAENLTVQVFLTNTGAIRLTDSEEVVRPLEVSRNKELALDDDIRLRLLPNLTVNADELKIQAPLLCKTTTFEGFALTVEIYLKGDKFYVVAFSPTTPAYSLTVAADCHPERVLERLDFRQSELVYNRVLKKEEPESQRSPREVFREKTPEDNKLSPPEVLRETILEHQEIPQKHLQEEIYEDQQPPQEILQGETSEDHQIPQEVMQEEISEVQLTSQEILQGETSENQQIPQEVMQEEISDGQQTSQEILQEETPEDQQIPQESLREETPEGRETPQEIPDHVSACSEVVESVKSQVIAEEVGEASFQLCEEVGPSDPRSERSHSILEEPVYIEDEHESQEEELSHETGSEEIVDLTVAEPIENSNELAPPSHGHSHSLEISRKSLGSSNQSLPEINDVAHPSAKPKTYELAKNMLKRGFLKLTNPEGCGPLDSCEVTIDNTTYRLELIEKKRCMYLECTESITERFFWTQVQTGYSLRELIPGISFTGNTIRVNYSKIVQTQQSESPLPTKFMTFTKKFTDLIYTISLAKQGENQLDIEVSCHEQIIRTFQVQYSQIEQATGLHPITGPLLSIYVASHLLDFQTMTLREPFPTVDMDAHATKIQRRFRGRQRSDNFEGQIVINSSEYTVKVTNNNSRIEVIGDQTYSIQLEESRDSLLRLLKGLGLHQDKLWLREDINDSQMKFSTDWELAQRPVCLCVLVDPNACIVTATDRETNHQLSLALTSEVPEPTLEAVSELATRLCIEEFGNQAVLVI